MVKAFSVAGTITITAFLTHRCSKKMVCDSMIPLNPQKFFKIKTGLIFCSEKCIQETVNAFAVAGDMNDIRDGLSASNGIILQEDVPTRYS